MGEPFRTCPKGHEKARDQSRLARLDFAPTSCFIKAMSKGFRDWDVEQVWLLPPSVQELVPEGHRAHLVRELVRESLDLSAIFKAYRREQGSPPFNPAMMTALLLYAYTQGVFSSRKIAAACEEQLDFMAVTGMQRPEHRTVCEFRRRHLPALGVLFVQVLKICQKMGMVKLGHVALDGTKVKANASKHKAMSYERMKEVEPQLAAEVERWLSQAESDDGAEDVKHGAERRGDELPEHIVRKQQRLEKIREAKAELETEAAAEAQARKQDKEDAQQAAERGERAPAPRVKHPRHHIDGTPNAKTQRNFTDPESKLMKTKLHSGLQRPGRGRCQLAGDRRRDAAERAERCRRAGADAGAHQAEHRTPGARAVRGHGLLLRSRVSSPRVSRPSSHATASTLGDGLDPATAAVLLRR